MKFPAPQAKILSISGAFSLYDLFTVGLALEIGGAALLVRATILSPLKILTENALWGSVYYRTVAATRNRTESFIGFCGLFLGFIVQVVGYTAYIAEGGRATYGIWRAILAGILAAILAPAWYVLGRLVNRWTFRPLLARVARQRANEPELAFPDAKLLVHCGEAAGYAALVDETVPAYLERVFKVRNSMLSVPNGGFVEFDQAPEAEWPVFERERLPVPDRRRRLGRRRSSV